MKKYYPYYMSVAKGVCLAACFLLLSALTALVIEFAATTGSYLFEEMRHELVCVFCTVSTVLIYNSFALSFSYGDRRGMEQYLEDATGQPHIGAQLRRILTDPCILLEGAVAHLIIAVFALAGGFPFIGGMFAPAMPLQGLFPMAVVLFVCLCLFVFAKYEAVRYWHRLAEENTLDRLRSPFWLPLRIALITVLYPLAMPSSPLLAYALFSLFRVFAKITALLSILGALAALGSLVLLVWGLRVLLGMRARKRLLDRMAQIAATRGYTVKHLKHPYRSFVTSEDHCSFQLEKGEQVYSCVVISTLWRTAPLVFTSPTDAHYRHRLGTKHRNLTLRHHIHFFHQEGQRLLIVDPVPKTVLVSEDKKEHRLCCTDTVWGIVVHDADSFLGCMERECLHRRAPLGERR